MEQTIHTKEIILEKPATGARLRGIPVYRLSGITEANLPLIKSTEMWVRYPRQGADRWCLVVPDAWRDAVEAGLAQHGIGLDVMERLPKTDNGIDRFFAKMLTVFGVGFTLFLAIQIGGSLGGLLALAVPMTLLLLKIESGNTAPEYGALVAPEARKSNNDKWNGTDSWDPMGSMFYADAPGTKGHLRYGG